MLVSDHDTQVLYETCSSKECSKSCYSEVGVLWLFSIIILSLLWNLFISRLSMIIRLNVVLTVTDVWTTSALVLETCRKECNML